MKKFILNLNIQMRILDMVYARHWGMKVFTALKGDFQGNDDLGNHYYQEKFLFFKPYRRPRRWVMYQDLLEGSSVPAEWFGWLRHEMDLPLTQDQKKRWQKPHQSHRTGRDQAYCSSRQQGNASVLKNRAPADYEPWRPL